MIKQAMTMVAWAAIAAAPAVVGAQTATTTPPTELATCDCPVGDARGGLRDLAAFAPLGLLGALAAAGGTPALFASQSTPPVVASGEPSPRVDTETPTTESGRTVAGDPPPSPRVVNDNVPDPVSPDSLRGGVRAPNTGTSLPSVLLLGSGLVAIGCVTIFRARG